MAIESSAIAIVQTGNTDAGPLFDQWRQPLIRYLAASGLRRDEALDIVQDVFLRLHQHLLSNGDRENLRAWIFQVAHNLAVNRRTGGAQRLSEPIESAAQEASPLDDPETLFFKKDRMRRLHTAIWELSAIQRECVLLRSEGLRYREIAAVLGIGTTTVSDQLERALRKLGEKCNV